MGFVGNIDGAEVVFQPPKLRGEFPRVWAFHDLCWVAESYAPHRRFDAGAQRFLHGRPGTARFALLYMVGLAPSLAWVGCVVIVLDRFLALRSLG